MANIGSIYRAHILKTLLKEAAGEQLPGDVFAPPPGPPRHGAMPMIQPPTGAPPRSINVNRPLIQPPSGGALVGEPPNAPPPSHAPGDLPADVLAPAAGAGHPELVGPPSESGPEESGLLDHIKGYLGQAGQFASDHPYLTGAGVLGGGLGLKALYDSLNQPEEDEEESAYLPVKMGAANRPAFFGKARRS